MEPTNYIFLTLQEANDFIDIINLGEGFPVPGGDTLTYCAPDVIWVDDIVDGEILGYSVVRDSITEKYYIS